MYFFYYILFVVTRVNENLMNQRCEYIFLKTFDWFVLFVSFVKLTEMSNQKKMLVLQAYFEQIVQKRRK